MTGIDTFYWDTCLFLAWLKDEQRPDGEMDGVRDFLERGKRGEILILTSVLTLTEVLEASIPSATSDALQDLFRRRSFRLLNINRPIAALAAELRRSFRDKGAKLATPDAIHLASAIQYDVTAFHTFDNGGSSKSVGLLELDGDVAGHKLRICKPLGQQQSLDLRSE